MHTLLAMISENRQAMDAIREVGPGKHFFGCAHTCRPISGTPSTARRCRTITAGNSGRPMAASTWSSAPIWRGKGAGRTRGPAARRETSTNNCAPISNAAAPSARQRLLKRCGRRGVARRPASAQNPLNQTGVFQGRRPPLSSRGRCTAPVAGAALRSSTGGRGSAHISPGRARHRQTSRSAADRAGRSARAPA